MSSAISREEADLTAPLSSTQAFETWGLKSGSVDFTVTGWASTITMVIAISNDDPAGADYYSEHTSLDIASDGNYSMQLPTGYNLVKLTWKSGSATAMENITFFGGF